MPASKHTHKATTAKLKRQWQHVRDSETARGASAGTADRIANGVIKRQTGRGKARPIKRRSRR